MKNRLLSFFTDKSAPTPPLFVKLVLSGVLLVVMIARQPELLYQPRFFAEEGMKYFAYAFSSSLLDNLVTAHYGYYTLYNGIATSIATIFSPENAPLATTYLALGVQMLTVGMVIWGRSPVFDTVGKRLVVALAIPLVSYAEIWLNTIGMQYWFCLMTFLMLLEEPEADSRGVQTAKCGLLALGGMTGVVSCFMTPVFLLKSLQTRSRKFICYTAVLTVCSLLQVSAFLRSWLSHDQEVQMRLVANNPLALLTKTVIFQFAIPFSGRGVYEKPLLTELSEALNMLVLGIFNATPFSSGFVALPFTVGTVILLFIAYQGARGIMRPTIRYTLLSFILVSGFSVLFSVNMSGGPRYTFAPSIMLLTLLIALFGEPRRPVATRLFASLLIAGSLIANTAEFRASMALAFSPDYPDWREEVKIWRIVGPAYPLKIWPPPWSMYLQKKDR